MNGERLIGKGQSKRFVDVESITLQAPPAGRLDPGRDPPLDLDQPADAVQSDFNPHRFVQFKIPRFFPSRGVREIVGCKQILTGEAVIFNLIELNDYQLIDPSRAPSISRGRTVSREKGL